MKHTLLVLVLFFVALKIMAQETVPVWQLGKNRIEPNRIVGNIKLIDGSIKLDGTNSFSLPADVLGKQNDYTIEFEVKRPNISKQKKGALYFMSNIDHKNKTGLGILYVPPPWGAGLICVNDGKIEQRGFLPDTERFYKLSFVVKDKKMQLFRDGLLLVMTDTIKPSKLPLTFGYVKKPVDPYEIRNIKIYDSAVFPTGYDPSIKKMRYCVGELYTMQRAEIKDKNLPRILVVGDSISMGYRRYISKHFEGKAYVDYWVGGGWFSWTVKKGDFPFLRAWKGVLSQGPYDVVSWNSMTLHMWSYNHLGRCPEKSIIPQFSRVIKYLKKTAPDTTFIWVRCTPWRNILPDGAQGIHNPGNDRIIKYNKIVDDLMQKEGIPEVDLYAIAEKQLHTVKKGSKDILHWNQDVSKKFADAIIKEIEKQLKLRATGE